jgi:selenophosphate synthase
MQNLLFDPQTSGGLLIFSHPDDAGKLLTDFRASGISAAEIGEAMPHAEHLLTVT